MLNCMYCRRPTYDIMVNMLNTREGVAVCQLCRPAETKIVTSEGIKNYITTEISLEEVAKQLNPDISCDFCNVPDPQWLYDLKMSPMYGVDLGTRWATCDPCAQAADVKDAQLTIQRYGTVGNIKQLMRIHTTVMQYISNKRPYVRDENDGSIRPL